MLGSASDSITLKPTTSTSKSDFYLEKIGESPKASFKLQYLIIEDFNSIYRASTWSSDSIAHSRISNCDIGIEGSIRVVNCMINNCRIGMIGGFLISSTITNCSEAAFESRDSFTIQNSTLSNSPIGLKDGAKNTGSSSSMMRVFKNNIVTGNTIGMEFYSSVSKELYTFSGNNISENETGLIVYSSGNLMANENNKICNNTEYNIEYTVKYYDMNAQGICWCTNDSLEIQCKIYDGYKDVDLSFVDFLDYIQDCGEDVITGIQPSSSELSVEVYPNPFGDYLNLNGYKGDVVVSDITGKVIYQVYSENKLETSNWDSGIYLLRLGSKVHKVTKR
jgi:hypothetical protein